MSQEALRILAIRLKTLQTQKSEWEVQVTEINKEIELISKKEIPELMEALGIKNVTFEGVGRVQLANDLYCSTKEGQKDVAMQWLRDTGYEGMISESYNATSMKALIRRLLVDGIEVPEFLNVTPFIRASVVKV